MPKFSFFLIMTVSAWTFYGHTGVANRNKPRLAAL
jgi:hypothetical protein